MTEIEKLDTLSTNIRMSSSKNEDLTNSSIIEFLNQEKHCLIDSDNMSELDVESIFDEINRLTVNADNRDVDEILREAENLMMNNKPLEGLDSSFNLSSVGGDEDNNNDKDSKLSRSASDSNQSDDSISISTLKSSRGSVKSQYKESFKVSVYFCFFFYHFAYFKSHPCVSKYHF